jgi:hypothetical protein
MFLFTQEAVGGELSSTNWDDLDVVQSDWEVSTPFEYTTDFEMGRPVSSPAFEEIQTNKEALMDQCRAATVFLAGKIQRQDYATLAKVFHVDESELTKQYPRLFFRIASTNNVVIYSETNSSNLEVEAGKHLILVHAKPGRHIITLTDLNAVQRWTTSPLRKFHHEGEYYSDSITFGRVNGKWKVGGTGGRWMDFDWNFNTATKTVGNQ